ncbi:hypothetical protein CA13_08170 [Planctomycetes bacterium CA13]|uniref:Uncharacterized protein n=1 Tax=Novipirellula herctigrandis TaxID=2527986 RepID=A0A5C5YXX1_9BACT|nr:hypothetical protein CA13_08170 [Planctomycetes bacterium CA13]
MLFFANFATFVLADPADSPASKDASHSVLERFSLRYHLNPGEKLQYEVTHQAKTKTRIRGAEEISQVHTISQRHWDILPATPEGEMVFDHVVDSVEMTQQQGEAEEIRWDSMSGEDPPSVFTLVAEQMGKKLATVTINPMGNELTREDHGGSKASLGMGSLTLQLPENPIAIGESWNVPHEVKARLENGEVKVIKIQERYTLEKVQTGVATLSIRSEPLTPMNEDSVRAQVVQQMSNGEIRFDIDNGRLLSKQLDWDETVVGFQGANSLMEYRARMTERLVEGVPHTAQKP